MVRLERVLYEKVVNNKLLGRNRRIGSPQTWFTKNNIKNSSVFWPGGYLVTKLLDPIFNFVTGKEYTQLYKVSKLQGVPMENFLALKEDDWRRGVLSEHMKRENLHPWVQMIHSHVRSRFHKVEKYQKGFEVPDEIVEETHGRPLIETISYAETMQNLMGEYKSEMMPNVYMFRSVLNPLDLPILHNLIDRESWNRMFYNEVRYDTERDEIEAEEAEEKRQIDMTDPKNQAKFRSWMENKIKLYPGVFVREGEQFDYETFFRDQAALNGHLKPSQEMSQEQIDALRSTVSQRNTSNQLYSDTNLKILNQDQQNEEVVERKNTVGIKAPEEITPMKYKAWMA